MTRNYRKFPAPEKPKKAVTIVPKFEPKWKTDYSQKLRDSKTMFKKQMSYQIEKEFNTEMIERKLSNLSELNKIKTHNDKMFTLYLKTD